MAGLKYVGEAGQWLPGVPARDLTEAEVAAYPEAQTCAFYVRADDEPKTAKRATKVASADEG